MTDLTTTHCTACRKDGAKWVLTVGDDRYAAHKPCAERIKTQAPEGVRVEIHPSDALRKQWAEERRERDARSFWAAKFQEAGVEVTPTGGLKKSAASFGWRIIRRSIEQKGETFMRIINLTQHAATAEQLAAGVFEPAEKEAVKVLITFEELPLRDELARRATALARIAAYEEPDAAMIGGAPYFSSELERALKEEGIKILYPFSKRESVEEPDGAGGMRKVSVFRHVGFVDMS